MIHPSPALQQFARITGWSACASFALCLTFVAWADEIERIHWTTAPRADLEAALQTGWSFFLLLTIIVNANALSFNIHRHRLANESLWFLTISSLTSLLYAHAFVFRGALLGLIVARGISWWQRYRLRRRLS